jgi:hypothetical protein
MAFVKGKPRVPTAGRRAGTPNKFTKGVKEMVLAALDQASGIKYLVEQSQKNPVAFLGLVGKILPLQLTGKDGGPIQHQNFGIDAPAKETREEWLARRHPAEPNDKIVRARRPRPIEIAYRPLRSRCSAIMVFRLPSR